MRKNKVPLKKIRLNLCKTQAALAKKADVDVKTLAAIEAGSRRGSDVSREKIKQAINNLRGTADPLDDEDVFGKG